MNWKHLSAWLLLVLMASGCVRSLHKLYTEHDLVFEPRLIGVWNEEGEDNTWTFRQSGEKSYTLCYFDAEEGSSPTSTKSVLGDSALFEAHLVELGGHLFMDLYPNQPEVKTDLCMVHMLPMHTIWKVELSEWDMKIAMLSQDWLQTTAGEGKLEIQHERVNDEIILTAPTQALQEFVMSFATDLKAFPQPAVLTRRES